MASADQLIARLAREREQLGSIRALSEKYEISATYIQNILASRKPISDRLARAMGYRRVVRYERLT